MLTEEEIRKIIDKQKEFRKAINDPIARKCTQAFIDGLECALND